MTDDHQPQPVIREPCSEFIQRINALHNSSGYSYRDLERLCDVSYSYVGLILKGQRHPSRDVLISLCVFAWKLKRDQVDDILMLAGWPPLGRTIRREWTKDPLYQPVAV